MVDMNDMNIMDMMGKNMQTQKISTLYKMVHAPFRKVVKFNLIYMGIGVIFGLGTGAYLVASGILGCNAFLFYNV